MFNRNFFNNLLILTGYQITWLACIYGELNNFSLVGLFIGIIYLILFFYFIKNKKKSLKICIFFSSFGYAFDSIMSYTNLYKIESSIIIGFLPIWFIILWPSFCTLFVSFFNFLKEKPLISFLLGSLFGPAAYYSGIILDIAISSNLYLSFIIMIIFWGSLMSLYSLNFKKFD